MKNLVIIHLESISRQRLAAFAAAFPHTTRLLGEALVFDNFFSSATSTRMALGYLFHANDFEFDTASSFKSMQAAANNPHLYAILRDRGYRAERISLRGLPRTQPMKSPMWPDDLAPAWETNEISALLGRFDALTDTAPFAIHVLNFSTNIDQCLALVPHSDGLTDQLRRAYAAADDAVGEMRAILERKGLLEETTIVLYGDHGDDMWTHGFKNGVTHATEPYTDMIWTPLAIRDPGLAPGTASHLASTIDIAPTCLSLLNIEVPLFFPHSGVDLLHGAGGNIVYSQNLAANQSSHPAGVGKAFSATDRTYTLLASARGLEFYAHRLDPGNHCNLLHFFTLGKAERLVLKRIRVRKRAAAFEDWFKKNAHAVESFADNFLRLRSALAARIAAKRAYIVNRGVQPSHALDPACLDIINPEGRSAFFRGQPSVAARAVARVRAFFRKLH